MELIKLQYLESATEKQEYSEQDRRLITVNYVNASFGNTQDYIELFIYDVNGELLSSNYTVTSYKIGSDLVGNTNQTTTLELDPLTDLKNTGRNRGTYVVHYNLLRNQLNTAAGFPFWIKEISSTRTEIKATRQDASNTQMSDAFDSFSATIGSSGYYPDFFLNFGENNLIIAVNAVYVEENGVGYMLFKLYEPLPPDFGPKSEFWVTTKVAEPVEYQVDIQVEADEVDTTRRLRGANFDIDVKQSVGETTGYYNYTSLFSTQVSSSLQQLQSYFDEKAVRINVDYSNFANFVHFSSITERLNNFKYKLSLIESYQASILQLEGLAPGSITNRLVSSSKATIQTNIDNIVTKFDPYEYYLYFTSASTAWPKSNDLPPYQLYSVTSSQAIAWLGTPDTAPTSTAMSMLYSASLYDNTNSNGLRYTTPAYIREDDENEPYLVFLDMIGQHFDNIWLYYKDVTSRYDAQNNPNIGISLDLVGDALRAFGITLYTNTNVSDNIYYTLLGLNETGSTLPITSSAYAQINLASSSLLPKAGDAWLSASIYLPPFGNEKINKYVTPLRTLNSGVTSSFQTISPNDLEAEVYKRLYHNLPYLLKTKGTERGVKALIACYGIPDSVLTIHEFGGYDMFTRPEILGIEDMKVYTGSVTNLSSDVLSPYATTQEYFNNNERTSYDLEVGFSPADSINADITSSLPNLSILQLIGNPALQYSSSYTPLDTVKNNYFAANYTSRYNVWDFIRLIKYYNNSLFKMIKDFVPARASVSTGIIVKSHILERNKYARHEPTATTSSHQSDIYTVSISGSDADEIKYSTAYISYTDTPSGSVPIYNIYSFEKYTGEFSGSNIVVTDGQAFDQADFSISSTSGSVVGKINYGALFQNISGSVKSERFLDLDYSTNQVIPVNLGLITKSLDEGRLAIQDPYAPFAQLQDYNYALRRSILPRYEGSKVSSLKYNTYTGPSGSYTGDKSYGLTAAVDRNSVKVGWVNNIPEENLNFYTKTTIYLKYLTDLNNELVELNRANRNLTDVQNIFKSGTPVVVSISDVLSPSFQKDLDGDKIIFKGGFSYDPILYREDSETLRFEHLTPISQSIVQNTITATTNKRYRYRAQDTDRFGRSALQTMYAAPDQTSNTDDNGTQYQLYVSQDAIERQRNGHQMAVGLAESQWNVTLNTWQQQSNKRINFDYPPQRSNNLRAIRKDVYAFRYVDFPNVTNIAFSQTKDQLLIDGTEDPVSNTVKFFRAPQNGTYSFSGTLNAYFRGDDIRLQAGQMFKMFVILESSTDINATVWNYVGEATLQQGQLTIDTRYRSDYGYDAATNSVFWDGSVDSYYKFNININHTTTAGTYYRFSFYLMTITNTFGIGGSNDGPGVTGFEFWFGDDPTAPGAVTPPSTLTIQQVGTSFTQYYYTSSYTVNLPQLFEISSSNTIVFSASSSYLFDTASYFTPEVGSVERSYYTQIIDTFGVQKYDLVRFGKFKDLNAAYYEVANVEVSGSERKRIVTFTSPVTSSYVNEAASFAILRPKPDETSVILEYTKRPGGVSPTILIPGDINKITLEGVGDIFKNLNPNLQ